MLSNIARGVNCTQVLRKAPAESKAEYRYDLINDNIVFYGGVDKENIIINYYPAPEELKLKAPNRIINLPDGITWMDCNDNNYIGYTYTEGVFELHIYNIKNNSIRSVEVSGVTTVSSIVLGKRCAVIVSGNTNYLINLITGTKASITNYWGKCDGELYTVTINNGKLSATKELNNVTVVSGIDISIPSSPDKKITFNADFSKVYVKKNNVLYLCDKNSNTVLTNITDNNFEVINNVLYYVNDSIYADNDIIIPGNVIYTVLGINKADNNTGYGISYYDTDNNLVVASFYNDTIIEFPNNFYYQYIAYMLAIGYKAKQNADSTSLMQQADSESNQFYNAIERDTNQYLRINNVYNGGLL